MSTPFVRDQPPVGQIPCVPDRHSTVPVDNPPDDESALPPKATRRPAGTHFSLASFEQARDRPTTPPTGFAAADQDTPGALGRRGETLGLARPLSMGVMTLHKLAAGS